ncbi:hypothetical protein BX666DRAFT_2022473 [Dichotomocladium elegans]|nr:hypothetical protein BX666DRAFT_2022473 [Dichotomocladium elegans]
MATSIGDDTVLELIFNPEVQGQPLGSIAQAVQHNPVKTLDPEVERELKDLETRAVKYAEQGELYTALELLSQCISREPEYASAYNNRAQVYRLLKDNDKAMGDLDNVIAKYGKGQPTILRQAYTQRAILKRSQGDQEGSRLDFEQGARYGNSLARTVAVQENPYAKMCNQIMMEVMSREINRGRENHKCE